MNRVYPAPIRKPRDAIKVMRAMNDWAELPWSTLGSLLKRVRADKIKMTRGNQRRRNDRGLEKWRGMMLRVLKEMSEEDKETYELIQSIVALESSFKFTDQQIERKLNLDTGACSLLRENEKGLYEMARAEFVECANDSLKQSQAEMYEVLGISATYAASVLAAIVRGGGDVECPNKDVPIAPIPTEDCDASLRRSAADMLLKHAKSFLEPKKGETAVVKNPLPNAFADRIKREEEGRKTARVVPIKKTSS